MSSSKSRNKISFDPIKRKFVKIVLTRLMQRFQGAHCELYYETPFQLLVSVVLSAQTTDKMVNRCMQPVYQRGFGPETVLSLGESGLLEIIRPIGLAPTKSRNILALTKLLIERYNGQVPDSREALQALPGVGRKTANVVLGEIYHQPTLAVDTHVLRVTQRLRLQHETNPEKAERALLQVIDARYLPVAHHCLVLHGRYVCKARKPDCGSCVLQDICPSSGVV